MTKEVFGTKEWAVSNVNFINGCIHDCKYCYSKEMAIRFQRKKPQTWKNEELRQKSFTQTFTKFNGRIMIPSSHDITPQHIDEALIIINGLLSANNDILIVSKPHFECIKKICEKFEIYKEKILFRFTIGSSDNRILKFWEPGAPTFEERLECLKFAYANGFSTSVSCEPLLDKNVISMVEILYPYISDSIWIGKANFLMKRLRTNGVNDQRSIKEAIKIIEWQSNDELIFKIYENLSHLSKIKWKESIKKVLDIAIPLTAGLDI